MESKQWEKLPSGRHIKVRRVHAKKKKNLFKQSHQPLALPSGDKQNSAALDEQLPNSELPILPSVK